MAEAEVPDDVLNEIESELNNGAQRMLGVEEQEDHEEVVEDQEQLPKGYKTLEEYIADGGDPDYYRGPKAFAEQRKIIDELKETKGKVKRIDDEMLRLQKFHDQEKKRLLSEIDVKRAKAKEDMDFEAYDQLGEQKRQLETAEPPQQQGEHPVIASFRADNPVLNQADPSYDPVYASAFAAAFNVMVQEGQQRAGRELAEAEIQRYLAETKNKLSPGQPQRRPSRVEPAKRQVRRDDPLEKMPAEIRGMYERWNKHTDPKKREYAKNLLAEYGG